jgi:hypothetical protein
VRKPSRASIVVVLGLLASSVVHISSAASAILVSTADSNHDGRADVWTYVDAAGRLLRVDIDTNFDGRSDVEESYAGGRLVRRASDRNFDDRIDLIDELDPSSGGRLRATVDADFDGRADLIVLFADGEPVYSEWATPATPAVRPIRSPRNAGDEEPLRALDDPFHKHHRFVAGCTSIADDVLNTEAPSDRIGHPVLHADSLIAGTRAPYDPAHVSASFQLAPAPRAPPALANRI